MTGRRGRRSVGFVKPSSPERLTLDYVSGERKSNQLQGPHVKASKTHAAAFGNFFVSRLNASAGITARVVSVVALAIVPSFCCRSFMKLSCLDLGDGPSKLSPGVWSPEDPGVPGADVMGSSGARRAEGGDELNSVSVSLPPVEADWLSLRAVEVEEVKDAELKGRAVGAPEGEREVRRR
jgi:hypothetical protein